MLCLVYDRTVIEAWSEGRQGRDVHLLVLLEVCWRFVFMARFLSCFVFVVKNNLWL